MIPRREINTQDVSSFRRDSFLFPFFLGGGVGFHLSNGIGFDDTIQVECEVGFEWSCETGCGEEEEGKGER